MGAPSLERRLGSASGGARSRPSVVEGTSAEEEEIRKREEALALEAVEHSLEFERLEKRESQVA